MKNIRFVVLTILLGLCTVLTTTMPISANSTFHFVEGALASPAAAIIGVSEVWVDDDFSPATPGWGVNHFAKIQDGINAIASPGTVFVAQGTYAENINNVSSKTVYLMGGYSSDFSIYNPAIYTSTIYGDGINSVIIFEFAPSGIIKGFEITHGSYGIYVNWVNLEVIENDIHGNNVGFSSEIGHHIIQNNDIHHNSGNGIELNSERVAAAIIGNRISGNGGIGIEREDVASVDIQRNIIIGNLGWGIRAQYAIAENNLIARNGLGGVWYWGGDSKLGPRLILNNTIANNVGEGLIFDDTDFDGTITNNIIWGNTTDLPQGTATYSCIGTGSTSGEGNISTAPLFIAPASNNYRLLGTSPCIDTGTNSGAPTQDIEGNVRPIDGNGDGIATTDMGSYESAARCSLKINIDGQGTVAKSPAQSNYALGAQVKLTATPASGWSFAGWSGDLTGNTNPVTITMSRNKTIKAIFIVKVSSITVTSPNGGENWETFSVHTITWSSTGVSGPVKIELSRDGGASWSTIIPLAQNDGRMQWIVLRGATAQAKIKVSSISNPALFDISDANFTIVEPSITVTSPNGGESWKIGSNQKITWNSTSVLLVKIELSRDGGATWTTIAASLNNQGDKTWEVTGPSTTHARIRVVSLSNSASDISNAEFNIKP